MTIQKQLKARIRARMARTGERYLTARRHVLAAAPEEAGRAAGPQRDGSYLLRGGVHPDTSALANVLAHHGVRAGHTDAPLSEAMVLGLGGGLGAGYILWEFKAHDARTLVLGFRNQWQYPERWVLRTLERLGVPAQVHHTGGAKAAAGHLDAALEAGLPALTWVDRERVGYWQLPAFLEGHGGYPVVAYAQAGARVKVDDRNLAPLSVARPDLDAARARIGSYKHRLVVPTPAEANLPEPALRAAALAGLRDQAEHLSQASDSFSLPAWRKWARLLTDTRNAKAWPKVFADRVGLVGALLSIYEGVEPLGTYGGHLRGLYAEFLDEAAELTGLAALRPVADAYRGIAERWHALAEDALPSDVTAFEELREALAAVYVTVVAEGDAGKEEARAAAERLWGLRARYDRDLPLDPEAVSALFARLADGLGSLYSAETAAVGALTKALPSPE